MYEERSTRTYVKIGLETFGKRIVYKTDLPKQRYLSLQYRNVALYSKQGALRLGIILSFLTKRMLSASTYCHKKSFFLEKTFHDFPH
jgi:hypothetical protein